jgi:hypothetical protein
VMEQRAVTKGIFEVENLRCRKSFPRQPLSVSEPSGKVTFRLLLPA